jgi:phytoene dehydrogenase-like protein
MADARSDVLVIGAGHNGLVCATYLAKAGLSVRVLERRSVVGGAAVTEEFHPGFRNSTASYTVSLLHPKVIRELDLHGHGLRIVERELGNFLPLPDGRYLKAGEGRTQAEVAKFSARDAARLPAYGEHLDRIAGLLRELAVQTPPNVPPEGGWLAALPELIRAAGLGRRAAALGIEGQRDLLDLFTDSAGAYLERWFESEPIQACSVSMAWSATTPAPTRPAAPTCCCTTSSARSTARPGCGAMRSAAWARSPRRWRVRQKWPACRSK